MLDPASRAVEIQVRPIQDHDLERVIRIDALHTGQRKQDYWEGVFERFLGARRGPPGVGLAAEAGGEVVGYLLGEVRAFEFGSEPCGWIFGVGVDPGHLRGGVASRLLAAGCQSFRAAGVVRVRTMVRRNNVPVLSLFRSNGFVAGTFAQLELDLEDRA